MNRKTSTVLDISLEGAMKKVREQFGPGALILGTREIRRKKEGGLGSEKIFELTVTEEASGGRGPEKEKGRPEGALRATGASGREILVQIKRLESLETSIQTLEEKLSELAGKYREYPLYDLLKAGDVSADTIGVVSDSFFKSDDGGYRDADEAARHHLERHLKVADAADWTDVSGTHMFFGTGGCGKTSLVIKLAGRLADAGRDVAVVTVFPRHAGEVRRLEVVADTIGIRSFAAYSLMEFERLLGALDGETTVLVDTPCVRTVQELTTDRFIKVMSRIDILTRHFVFDLNVSKRQLQVDLDLFNALACDFCVLTKLDILCGQASFLDLLAERLLPFSILNASPDFDRGLEIASIEKLVSMIDSVTEDAEPEKTEDIAKSPRVLSENQEDGAGYDDARPARVNEETVEEEPAYS